MKAIKAIQQCFRTQDKHTNVSVFLYTWRWITQRDLQIQWNCYQNSNSNFFFFFFGRNGKADPQIHMEGFLESHSNLQVETAINPGGLRFPISKFHPMLSESKHCGTSIMAYTQELNWDSRCIHPWPTDCWQRCLFSGERTVSLTKASGTAGEPPAKEWRWNPTPYTTCSKWINILMWEQNPQNA